MFHTGDEGSDNVLPRSTTSGKLKPLLKQQLTLVSQVKTTD